MFTVYGGPQCPYCKYAVDLLVREGYEYEFINLHDDEDARRYVVETLRERKIPQIFDEEVHIGGYTDLTEYLRETGFDNLF